MTSEPCPPSARPWDQVDYSKRLGSGWTPSSRTEPSNSSALGERPGGPAGPPSS